MMKKFLDWIMGKWNGKRGGYVGIEDMREFQKTEENGRGIAVLTYERVGYNPATGVYLYLVTDDGVFCWYEAVYPEIRYDCDGTPVLTFPQFNSNFIRRTKDNDMAYDWLRFGFSTFKKKRKKARNTNNNNRINYS